MGVHHFFVAPEEIADDVVVLSGAEAHHAARVLRVQPGERITVADGTGRLIDAAVATIGDMVTADVRGVRHVPVPLPAITIHQALMKGDRMDDMIERAVEVGVRRVVPFTAERSIVRWDDAKRLKACERWNQIALAASKQSRSPWLTTVDSVASDAPEHPALVLHEEAGRRLREALPDEPPAEIELVVGPEGGLAPGEIARLEDAGATAVSLGERILRTDFAGPVAAAIVAFVYGSLG